MILLLNKRDLEVFHYLNTIPKSLPYVGRRQFVYVFHLSHDGLFSFLVDVFSVCLDRIQSLVLEQLLGRLQMALFLLDRMLQTLSDPGYWGLRSDSYVSSCSLDDLNFSSDRLLLLHRSFGVVSFKFDFISQEA